MLLAIGQLVIPRRIYSRYNGVKYPLRLRRITAIVLSPQREMLLGRRTDRSPGMGMRELLKDYEQSYYLKV